MNGFILTIIACIAALIGGLVALKGRKYLNQALGFTAGLILGLVAFEILPEIFRTAQTTHLDFKWPMIAFVSGFLFFHIIERTILLHGAQESQYSVHQHRRVGTISALALCGHSFLDGVSIGLAFQINTAVGAAVAIAVIGHRFADGFNTTNVMLHHHNEIGHARRMLYLASVMPILGLLSTYLFNPSENFLAIYLGFFAGFIFYIGASDILPQAHSKSSSRLTTLSTVLGAILMLALSHIA